MVTTDALSVVSWRARPRSFVALMSLYESNYIRLGWLAGDLRVLKGRYCSVLAADCELALTVSERSAYTTTLNLTYWLPKAGAAQTREPVPDMTLRIYHDARLLEALSWMEGERQAGRSGAVPPPAERELGQRWARNMMLNKWLEYCAERGHRFVLVEADHR